MPNTLSRKGAATKNRMIEAAAELIREKGTAATSLDDVLEATSTGKSQMFHYFAGGRADLLVAVAEHEAEQVLAAQEPFLSDLSSSQSWERWRVAVLEHYTELGDRCPLGVLTSELGKSSPETRSIVTRLYDTWENALRRGISKLESNVGSAGPTNPNETARTILTAIQGGVVMLRATGRVTYLETALSAALAPLELEA